MTTTTIDASTHRSAGPLVASYYLSKGEDVSNLIREKLPIQDLFVFDGHQ